jgi:LysM repeat protein
MKKIFLTLFFAASIFVLWSSSELLWSNRRLLDEPRVHKIEKGEYLSKIAQKYYGDPQRWHELALINRAPNPHHVEAGEEILVPAAKVVEEIERTRTLTRVNLLVDEQERLVVRGPAAPVTTTTPPPATVPSPEATTGNEATEPMTPANGGAESFSPEVEATEPSGMETPMSPIREIGFEAFRNRRTYGEDKPKRTELVELKEHES